MKIVTRSKFLKYPEGIFFCKGMEWVFDSFCVKGETYQDDAGKNIDFTYLDLAKIEAFNSEECFKRLENSLKHGTSYKINEDYGRDGCFDDQEIFMIFEKEDLLFIKKLIEDMINDH